MTDAPSLVDRLARAPLFAGLPETTLVVLADGGTVRRYAPREAVFHQGEAGTSLYVILDGSVTVVRDAPGEPVRRPVTLGPGEFFGEMGLMEGEDRSASVHAAESVRLLELPKTLVEPLLERHPLLAVKLRAAVIRRHGSNVASTVDLAQRREIRTHMRQDAELELADGRRLPVRLENLSPGGARISKLPADWTPNRLFELTLHLAGASRPIQLEAVVAWRDGDSGGLAFRAPSPETAKLLREAVRSASSAAAPRPSED